MANFRTHLAVAAVASTGVAGILAGLGTVSFTQAGGLAALGLFGGILPDIDSDNSSAIKIVFNLMAGFFSILAFLMTYWSFDIIVTGIACVISFVVVRYPVRWIFAKFTVHRGVFHSILAAAMMGLLFTVAADIMLVAGEILSWYIGSFVTLGYLVHLLLDEFYSVDFSNARIKKSFGSAIKPLSLKYPIGTILFLSIAGGLYYLTPATNHFFDSILQPDKAQTTLSYLGLYQG